MVSKRQTRRSFLQTTTAAAAAGVVSTPYFFSPSNVLADDAKAQSANDRPLVGCIGTGSRWNGVGPDAMKYGDCVAVCDVDREHAEKAKAKVEETQNNNGQSREVDLYEDYQKILDRKDVDIVTIVTPDHWHTKIAIEAMQAGKDVYCEKPLTLTIDEGKQIIKALEQTQRVLQVGTQQRSEMRLNFLKALALVKEGRLGKIQSVQCAIGGADTSAKLQKTDPPSHLNWEKWQGQTPLVDYIKERCHYEFRWWYEYSGGKMTDWGAHHVDIAQWAIGMDHTGPLTVKGVMAKHPVPLKDGYPTEDDRYNAATEFLVECEFPGGVQMTIRHDTRNGILITGDQGRLFVSRGNLSGKPVEELAENPLPEDAITKVYKGKQPGDHMRNFFECVKTREQPISDVYTHHRAVTTCHLANIAIRLREGQTMKWDPKAEQIVDDEEANAWLKRDQRQGYEIPSLS